MSDTDSSRNLMARFLAAMPTDERAEFLAGIATHPAETNGTGASPSTLDTTGDATRDSGGDGRAPSQERPTWAHLLQPPPPLDGTTLTGGDGTTPRANGVEHTTGVENTANRHVSWTLPGQATMGTTATRGTTPPLCWGCLYPCLNLPQTNPNTGVQKERCKRQQRVLNW